MQKIWNWIRNNGLAITAITGACVLFVTAANTLFLNPIHQRLDDLRAHIDQRFDAQDKHINQRFDDQDKQINQRFDAQDKYINQRFDDQNKQINQRFDAQGKYINQRFDAQDKYINQRFDAQDVRIEDLAKDLANIHKLSDRVSQNEGQIDVIREQLQTADAPTP